MNGLERIKEGSKVCSTIFGQGICAMIMDKKYGKYFINVHFDSGLEMAYDAMGRHHDYQLHRDLYTGSNCKGERIHG